MQRNLENRDLSKTGPEENGKRPRGRPSKSDLLKEEVQQNERVGAFTIFGCLKKMENVGKKKEGESSRTIAPVTDKLDDKNYSLKLKTTEDELAKTKVTEEMEDLKFINLDDFYEPQQEMKNCPSGDKQAAKQEIQSSEALNNQTNLASETIKDIANFKESDFIETKRISQNLAAELVTARSKSIILSAEIKQLNDALKQTETRKNDHQIKIASLDSVINEQSNETNLKWQIIENLKSDLSDCRAEIDFYIKQPPHVHQLIKLEEENFKKYEPLPWGILHSLVMNTERNTNLYTIEERDFWIDRYYHTLKSEFDNLLSNLNGPHISTVRKWIGPRQKIDIGLSAKRRLNAANFYQNTLETVNTISEGGGLDLTVLDME